jgi:hypothetical protein
MPKGLSRIATIAAEAQQRSDAYGTGEGLQRALVLKKSNDPKENTATGRFLEAGNDITFLYFHELPLKPQQRYGDKVLCLDQDDIGVACPGCESEGVRRTARIAINFIRYDEPKLRRGPDGKPIKDPSGQYVFDGVAPQIVVWNAPQSVGGRLAYLESRHGGLSNHVVTIHRTPDDKNPWMIDVIQANIEPDHPDIVANNGGKPFERKLFEKKIDPQKAITQLGVRSIPLMSYGDMKRAFSGVSVPSGFQPSDPNAAPMSENVYARAAEASAAGHGKINPGAFGN